MLESQASAAMVESPVDFSTVPFLPKEVVLAFGRLMNLDELFFSAIELMHEG